MERIDECRRQIRAHTKNQPAVLSLLFRGIKPGSPAAKAISMNITANLLGLGNAATPLGIAAMRELEATNQNPSIASNDMITFVVLNTASLQLIPTTTAALRMQAGSASPFDILPAVWAASLASVVVAVLLSILFRSAVSHRGIAPAKIGGAQL